MYAKDKVHPRLQQVDEDKISRLYGELRRESLASGSIPITVRHIESMIRMAEAHARLHLREYVRGDDIDLAIRVMLESFIGAQKYAVMKSLRRSFARYLHSDGDHEELLYHVLSGMIKEKLVMVRFQHRQEDDDTPHTIVLSCDDFEARARELTIHDVSAFYASPLF